MPVMYRAKKAKKIYYGSIEVRHAYASQKHVWCNTNVSPRNCLTFIPVSQGGSTLSLQGSTNNDIDIYYSLNYGPWQRYTIGETITLYELDDSVSFWNHSKYLSSDAENFIYFNLESQFLCSGAVQSLTDFRGPTPYCFYSLFKDCQQLRSAPSILADTVAPYCYAYMFQNCSAIVQVPQLRAVSMQPGCYKGMFYGCTGIQQAPQLPAQQLAVSCYYQMFYQCTSLTKAPQLPAQQLASSCYSYMFYMCTSLIEAPELPALQLANSCYAYMFRSCYALTKAPALPATTLASSCYYYMFANCTSLTQMLIAQDSDSTQTETQDAFQLPAQTLTQYCYSRMFYGCNKLETPPRMAAIEQAYSSCSGMFQYCNALTCTPPLFATKLAQYCYQKMFRYCQSLVEASSLPAQQLQSYCYQDMFEFCRALVRMPAIAATSTAYRCCANMFKSCTALVEVSPLRAVQIASQGYAGMFAYCYNLQVAPEIYATKTHSRCCYEMFAYCTKLLQAPELHARVLESQCYSRMFYVCSALNVVKVQFLDWLYGTSTSDWLYGVAETGTFYKQLALDTSRGSSMIPTSWEVRDIFELQRDIPLTFTAAQPSSTVKLTKTGQPVVDGLLYRRSQDDQWTAYSIDQTILLQQPGDSVQFMNTNTQLSTSYAEDGNQPAYVNFVMTGKVKASGNMQSMLNNSTQASAFCFAGLFEGCQSLIRAPKLFAQELAAFCYFGMFRGCPGLTTAPQILQAPSASECYAGMFRGCPNLAFITVNFTDWNPSGYSWPPTYRWLAGVAAQGTFYSAFGLAANQGENYIPSDWTVLYIDA